jgi:hypothetical protein
VNELNKHLQVELKATALFDYGSVEKLATFIAEQCRPRLAEAPPRSASSETSVADASTHCARTSSSNRPSSFSPESAPAVHSSMLRSQHRETEVAVIGMSGRFPDADNVEAFWRNLAAGKNCVREVPPERWDHSLVYDPDSRQADKTNSKWGGFWPTPISLILCSLTSLAARQR